MASRTSEFLSNHVEGQRIGQRPKLVAVNLLLGNAITNMQLPVTMCRRLPPSDVQMELRVRRTRRLSTHCGSWSGSSVKSWVCSRSCVSTARASMRASAAPTQNGCRARMPSGAWGIPASSQRDRGCRTGHGLDSRQRRTAGPWNRPRCRHGRRRGRYSDLAMSSSATHRATLAG